MHLSVSDKDMAVAVGYSDGIRLFDARIGKVCCTWSASCKLKPHLVQGESMLLVSASTGQLNYHPMHKSSHREIFSFLAALSCPGALPAKRFLNKCGDNYVTVRVLRMLV